MKVLLFTLSVIGCTIAEAPHPEPRKPEGALLLLPPEYNKKTEYYSLPSGAEDLAKISDKVMERLRQEQGSGSGSYHVYLNDGRLQKVQFTTAPVKSSQQNTGTQQSSGFQSFGGSQQVEVFSAQQNQQQQYATQQRSEGGLNPVIAHFGKLQQELQQQQIQQLEQRQKQLELQQQELKQQQEELKSASYVASLRYTNVDPITSPIYSYKPSPVTRILRYAPQYY